MEMFGILGTAVLLESLKKFEQNLLRDFTPSSLQVSILGESEFWIQIVCHRIERPPH